jgi:hypothetical protein
MVASFRMVAIDAQAKASDTFNSRMCLQDIWMKPTRKITRAVARGNGKIICQPNMQDDKSRK